MFASVRRANANSTQMEAICDVFYTQPGSPDWAAAKAHVDALSTSAEHIPTCQQLLDHSQVNGGAPADGRAELF